MQPFTVDTLPPCLRMSALCWELMCRQEQTGIPFDVQAGTALAERIRSEMTEIETEVEPQLPPRPLLKGEEAHYRIPAKPFKQDGTLSATMMKFLERVGAAVDHVHGIVWNGNTYKIEPGFVLPATAPMKIGNQDHLKDWFISLGWQPTLFNVKKDERGKPIRDERGDPITTSPKIQDKGQICPNLLDIDGDLPRLVVRFLSLRNRLSVLEGWLSHPRIKRDGRLPAGFSGITPTHRIKHTVVTNVPKADPKVLLGKEFRSLFRAEPGKVFVGYDASSLEDRVKAALTYKFDGGAYAEKILDPEYDAHSENAAMWGLTRQEAKSGTYALAYQCGVRTLAKTLKCSEAKAKVFHEAYWANNEGLRLLGEAIERHWEACDKKYIVRRDSMRLYARSKHSLVNLAIQGHASAVMDFAGAWMHKALGGDTVCKIDHEGRWVYTIQGGFTVERVAYVHDEYLYQCDPGVAEWVAELGCTSIRKAGEYLKFAVPLEAEAKIGGSWADVH